MSLRLVCPCLAVLAGETEKNSELQPCKSGEDNGSEDEGTSNGGQSKLGAAAAGLFGVALAPITAFKERRAEDQARKERTAVLQAGAPMKLLSYRGSTNAKVQLSSDGAMVTWQTERTGPDQPGESGVLALAMIREIKPVMQSGLGALLGSKEVPLQWMIVADEETVKFEAESETARHTWMSTLDELAKRQQEAKAERKMGYAAQRQMGIEQRRRDAERRKAEVLKTCGGGGMKHAAKAMMSRN